MRILLALAALAACGYAAAAARVWFGQRRVLFRPVRELAGTPADEGLAYSDVRPANRLGTTLHGWHVPCAGARFTLLFFHGNGGNVSHRLASLRLFHDLGASVLLIDYSGYGRSEGEPSETALLADARAAWDLAVGQGARPEDVIIFGRSLGGAVAAGLTGELAAEGVRPCGLILESTFTSAADMGVRRYPWLPVRRLIRDLFDSAAALAGVRVPALFAHSPGDEVVPFELGRALYEGYGGPKSFLPLRGDHNRGYLEMGEDYPAGLARFLDSLAE